MPPNKKETSKKNTDESGPSEASTFLGIKRIVSGGQTGVDRAALDVAIQLGIEHGGWCPRGRLAEDGQIAARYHLQELPSSDYADRTRQNVVDSDGTLILYRQRLQGGTLLTNRIAQQLERPLCRVRLDRPLDFGKVHKWLRQHQIDSINVAGPRGSSHPELYSQAFEYLHKLLTSPQQLDLIES